MDSDDKSFGPRIPKVAKVKKPTSQKAIKATENAGKSLQELGLESFDVVEIHRSEIQKAPYNPRVLNDAERRHLKAGLSRHGMVAPVTWNARTGNLVGGHQRVGQLDALAGTSDYRLRVAKIDVDEGREKELNILLNNPNAMGDWDLGALESMLRDDALDLGGAGFDTADVFKLFGSSPLEERSTSEELTALAEKVREARDRYDAIKKSNGGKRDREDFYLVVCFKDTDDLTDFLASAGLPDNRYQSGAELRRLTGLAGFGEDESGG